MLQVPNHSFEWNAPTVDFAACFRTPQASRFAALFRARYLLKGYGHGRRTRRNTRIN